MDYKMTSVESPTFSLNYQFANPELLKQALRHKSYANEKAKEQLAHNEKLEFLGDAVIDLVLSEYLMEKFPGDEEGSLSKKRASLVNETALAEIASRLNIMTDLKLGKGEIVSEGHKKPRLLSSAYEAIIGAVFLDGGFDSAKKLAREHFEMLLEMMDSDKVYMQDFKTQFQEVAQATLKATPQYEVIKEEGPSHLPQFHVRLSVQGKMISEGIGRSKKLAEQEAARIALLNWRENDSE
jgi:ribonuclease-3